MSSTALVIREYEGVPVFFQTDACLNVTATARQFGKWVQHSLDADRTKDYLSAVARRREAGKTAS